MEHEKERKSEDTIKTQITILRRLSKLCNITEPEQIKATLATLKWKNVTKHHAANYATHYLKYIRKTWEEPKYTPESTLPYIPTEQEIDNLIAAASRRMATLLQLLKETGARSGEIANAKWIDIDTQRKAIYIRAEKGNNSRLIPISNTLINMLNQLPKNSETIFKANKHSLRNNFDALRNRTAAKLNNPRLKAIHLHTLRHWKATTEYHNTKDIIHVKTILGHKDIESTMTYINIESALWLADNDDFTCKVAKTVEEATQLIENGFEYVDTMDGIKLYKKRK